MNRLLIIDDELEFCDFVRHVAEERGYRCEITTDAMRCRELLGTFRPTVVAIDLKMPSHDGVQLLNELSSAGYAGSVIIISGLNSRTLATARQLGENLGLKILCALAKPARADALRNALDATLIEQEQLSIELIARALDNGEFTLVYQPQVTADTGDIAGVEALVRWRHAGRDIWPPSRFIDVIETSDLVDRFSQCVFAMAVGQARDWRDQGLSLQINVNVSGANVGDNTFPDQLEEKCREVGVPPASIGIEITETVAMRDPRLAMDVLTRLRLKGFSLSIDDFGVGYSSLVQLQRLPFQCLKIDKSFVARCSSDPDSRTIVKAVTDLAHALDLRVVAEGVEDAESWRTVRDVGCDVGQGFFFARPMRSENLIAWIRERAHFGGNLLHLQDVDEQGGPHSRDD